jgi:hypothetical protein
MEKRSRKAIRDPTISTNHEIDFNSKFEHLRLLAFKLIATMQKTIDIIVVNEFPPFRWMEGKELQAIAINILIIIIF